MRALILVDVQNDFCEGGALAVAGGADVAAGLTELLRRAPDSDPPGYDLVVATLDWHVDPGDHFSAEPDYRESWPVHCVAGTHGANFHPALDTGTVDAVFHKGHYSSAYSGFEGVHAAAGDSLTEWLRRNGVTHVDVAGIATDYCVRATAADAVAAGFSTRVLLGLTAAVAPHTAETALAELTALGVVIG